MEKWKPQIPLESKEADPAVSLEKIIPGIKMYGLQQEKPGLYLSPSVHPSDTSSVSSDYSQNIERRILNVGDYVPGEGNSIEGEDYDLEQIKELEHFFKGKVVVDLGAGGTPAAYYIARVCGARAYIGAEPNHFSSLYDSLHNEWQNKSAEEAFPILKDRAAIERIVVGEDMRDFIKRLPDDSVCVFTFGIDDFVLDKMPGQDRGDIERNLVRVLDPKGAHLCGENDSLRGWNELNEVPTQHAMYASDGDGNLLFCLYTKEATEEKVSQKGKKYPAKAAYVEKA